MRLVALAAITLSSFLVVFLSATLARHILGPLARLPASATGRVQADKSGNIVSALANSVQALMRNTDQIRKELDKSREHLVQAEKMALVDKLAAGMAHSMPPPLHVGQDAPVHPEPHVETHPGTEGGF